LGTSMTIGDGVMTAAASGTMLVNHAASVHPLQHACNLALCITL